MNRRFDQLTLRQKIGRIALTLLMWSIGFVFIFPLLWMLSTSLKIESAVFQRPIQWIPTQPNWNNYKIVLMDQSPSFFRYYLNSIWVTGICLAGNLFLSALAAYGFTKMRFRGRDKLFLIYLCGMMVPFQVLMVPRFMMFRMMGIYNTHWAIILPNLCTTIGVFLLRQSFQGVPFALNEAARIDGAKEFRIFWQIILPMAKPALTSLAILTFVWRWNDYEAPLIFITNPKLYTLPLGLTNFIEETGSVKYTLVMAASVCALLPVIVVFLAAQKQIISGLTEGSVKG